MSGAPNIAEDTSRQLSPSSVDTWTSPSSVPTYSTPGVCSDSAIAVSVGQYGIPSSSESTNESGR